MRNFFGKKLKYDRYKLFTFIFSTLLNQRYHSARKDLLQIHGIKFRTDMSKKIKMLMGINIAMRYDSRVHIKVEERDSLGYMK